MACALSCSALCKSARTRTSETLSTVRLEHRASSHITFNLSNAYCITDHVIRIPAAAGSMFRLQLYNYTYTMHCDNFNQPHNTVLVSHKTLQNTANIRVSVVVKIHIIDSCDVVNVTNIWSERQYERYQFFTCHLP